MTGVPDRAHRLARAVPLWMAYLIVALPTVLMFALLVPIGQVADEPAHLMRVASIADGQLAGHRAPSLQPDGTTPLVTGVDIDSAVRAVAVAEFRPPGPVRWTGERHFAELHTIATYMPAFYGPMALGFGAAKAFGASPWAAALAGRLAGGLVFVLIGVLALRVAVQGQALLVFVLAVPMTLSLGASYNQDGLIIATTALAAACMTRVVAARMVDRLDGPALAGACLCLALVVAVKPPYFPLAAMLLLPLPIEAGRVEGRRALVQTAAVALVLLPAALWGWFVMKDIVAPVPRPAYEAGPLWPGPRPATFTATDPAAQIKVLLSDPVRLVTVPSFYLFATNRLRRLVQETVGVLGWLDLFLYGWLYWAWGLAFAGSLWAFARPRRVFGSPAVFEDRRSERALLALAALASLWGVLLSQYLSWTNVGERTISGPQGRYLLPILATLALWPPRDGRRVVPLGESSAWMPLLVALLGLAALSRLVMVHYHG